MSYAALKVELALPAYAGLSDAAAAAALLGASATDFADINPSDWWALLVDSGDIVRLSMAASFPPSATLFSGGPNATDTLVGRAKALLVAVQPPSVVPLRTTKAGTRAAWSTIINALVTGSVIQASTRDAMVALATVATNRAAQLGFPLLNDQEVRAARFYNG